LIFKYFFLFCLRPNQIWGTSLKRSQPNGTRHKIAKNVAPGQHEPGVEPNYMKSSVRPLFGTAWDSLPTVKWQWSSKFLNFVFSGAQFFNFAILVSNPLATFFPCFKSWSSFLNEPLLNKIMMIFYRESLNASLFFL